VSAVSQASLNEPADDQSTPASAPVTDEDTEVPAELNMNIDSSAQAMGDLHGEPTIPNIWALDHEQDTSEGGEDSNGLSRTEEEELEKPSFLRRLKKRRGQKNSEDSDKSEE
jgi:hypothetical protein